MSPMHSNPTWQGLNVMPGSIIPLNQFNQNPMGWIPDIVYFQPLQVTLMGGQCQELLTLLHRVVWMPAASPHLEAGNAEFQATPQTFWTRICILTSSQVICRQAWEALLERMKSGLRGKEGDRKGQFNSIHKRRPGSETSPALGLRSSQPYFSHLVPQPLLQPSFHKDPPESWSWAWRI